MNFFSSKKKKGNPHAPSKTESILDKTLYTFPDKKNTITIRESCEGAFITGVPGSGKSSGFAQQYFKSMVKFGMGGLIINVKSDADEEMSNLINQALNENNTL